MCRLIDRQSTKTVQLMLFLCLFSLITATLVDNSNQYLFKDAECNFSDNLCNWNADGLEQKDWKTVEDHNRKAIQIEKRFKMLYTLFEPIFLHKKHCLTLTFTADVMQFRKLIKLRQIFKKENRLYYNEFHSQYPLYERDRISEYKANLQPNTDPSLKLASLQFIIDDSPIRLLSITVDDQACPVTSICTFELGNECNIEAFHQLKEPFEIFPDHHNFEFPNQGTDFVGHRMTIVKKIEDGMYEFDVKSPIVTEDVCLHFKLLRKQTDFLNVWLKSDSHDRKLVWNSNQLHFDDRVEITLTNPKENYLVFQVVHHRNNFESLRMNDFQFKRGTCKSTATCDFQNDLCSYEQTSYLMGYIGQPFVRNSSQILNFNSEYLSTPTNKLYFDITGLSSNWNQRMINSNKVLFEMKSFEFGPTKLSSLTFTYMIQGVGELNNRISAASIRWSYWNYKKKHILFDERINTGGEYRQGCFNYRNTEAFQLNLVIELQSSISCVESKCDYNIPFVAIGDLRQSEGKACPTESTIFSDLVNELDEIVDVKCDFIRNTCKWTAEGNWASGLIAKDEQLFPYLNAHDSKLSGLTYTSFSTQSSSHALKSPLIEPQKIRKGETSFCLHFANYMRPNNFDSLLRLKVNLMSSIGNQEILLYELDFTKVRKSNWQWSHIDFDSAVPFHLKLETDLYSKSVIAIQYLNLRTGSCHHQSESRQGDRNFCDFEFGQCQFYLNSNDLNPFKREYLNDHSNLIKKGYAMQVNLNHHSASKEEQKSSLIRHLHPSYDGYCVRFWIQFATKGTFKVQSQQHSDSIPTTWLNVESRFHPDSWFPFQVDIAKFNHPIELNFVFEYNQSGKGRFAIDDVDIVPESCNPLFECDFEGTCLWDSIYTFKLYYYDDRFKKIEIEPTKYDIWKVSNLFGRSTRTDHTLNSLEGHFLYLEGYSPVPYRSPILTRNGETKFCFDFSYRQITDSKSKAADLDIFVSHPSLSEMYKVYSEKGNDSLNDEWISKRITFHLPTSVSIFETTDELVLYLVPNSKEKNKYNIHLDDINLERGECTSAADAFKCKDSDNTQVSMEKVCDHIVDCPNGADEANCIDCGFQKSFCGYKSESSIEFNNCWNLDTSLPLNQMNSEKIELNRLAAVSVRPLDNFDQENWLRSPIIHHTHATCDLEISYMTNAMPFELLVQGEYGTLISVWKPKTIESKEWITESVHLGSNNQSIRLIFKQKFVSNQYSSLALASVKAIDCAPPQPSWSGSCKSGEFSCSNKVCIAEEKICDFGDDCSDNSDEQNCSYDLNRCDFEGTTCDWILSDDDADDDDDDDLKQGFQLSKGKHNLDIGPTRDHTRGWSSGHFLLLQLTAIDDNQEFGEVRGVQVNVQEGCVMRFFYMNKEGCSLTIRLQNNESELSQELSLRSDYNWNRAEVDLNQIVKLPSSYQVVIEGKVFSPSSYVAIDDVTFTENCYQMLNESVKIHSDEHFAKHSTPKPSDDSGYRVALCLLVFFALLLLFAIIAIKARTDRQKRDHTSSFSSIRRILFSKDGSTNLDDWEEQGI